MSDEDSECETPLRTQGHRWQETPLVQPPLMQDFAENTACAPRGTRGQETTGMTPGRRLDGTGLSPDELSALVAVVILATSSGEVSADPDKRSFPEPPRCGASQWGSPARMVRRTPPHGSGGWRRSAFPD